MCYKLGQTYDTSWDIFSLLQIVSDFLTNWCTSTIKYLGKSYYELGQYKMGQLLQHGAIFITNSDRSHKSGQLLQIGA